MTCVIAIRDGNTVWMGADSCISSTNLLERDREKKIYKKGEYLIGNAGGVRTAQVIKYGKLPEPPATSLHRFMCTKFIQSVRAVLKEGGVLRTDKDTSTESARIRLIVGVRGRVFVVWGGFSVVEIPEDYTAIGSGLEYAYGSLETTKDNGYGPKERIKIALKVAGKYAEGVRGPYYVKKQEWYE